MYFDDFNFLKQDNENLYVSLKVVTNANKTYVTDIQPQYIKIKVKALPVDNKANSEIIAFFSTLLNVKKSNISIILGQKSKFKTIIIKNYKKEHFLQICNSLAITFK